MVFVMSLCNTRLIEGSNAHLKEWRSHTMDIQFFCSLASETISESQEMSLDWDPVSHCQELFNKLDNIHKWDASFKVLETRETGITINSTKICMDEFNGKTFNVTKLIILIA